MLLFDAYQITGILENTKLRASTTASRNSCKDDGDIYSVPSCGDSERISARNSSPEETQQRTVPDPVSGSKITNTRTKQKASL